MGCIIQGRLMIRKVLVTGGAGFIGSHIVDKLVNEGYKVTILDSLDKQVHQGKLPPYLNNKATFIKGDVLNYTDLEKAINGIDAIYHEASAVGVGQSMYQIDRYVKQNSYGTAKLLDFLANKKHKIQRIIVASSMSAYGEGLYNCLTCNKLIRPPLREDKQMSRKDWELHCPTCNNYLTPVGIPETEKFSCNSIYAVTKQTQEDMFMIFGKTYGIPATAFRYFNVYGPRQSLSNPYTGVAAIFLSRLKNNEVPVIYEDGLQARDFISVYDIAEANVLALENSKTSNQIFNLGTGNPIAIKDISLTLSRLIEKDLPPKITNNFRSGDVRHCFADNSKIKKFLKWNPRWSFEQGMIDLIQWSKKEQANDTFTKASQELKKRGLIKT